VNPGRRSSARDITGNGSPGGPRGGHDAGVDVDVDGFVRDGFTVVRGAFDADTAAGCRDGIWDALAGHGVRRDDRGTWRRPSIRVDTPDGAPFRAAAGSPALHPAYDELIGAGRWTPRPDVGGTVPAQPPAAAAVT
jgi:hypothetical protein